MGSFCLALNSNPLAGSLLLIACTAFLRSGWYHLLLLLPSTGKACKKSLSCARKSIPRALHGCCKNKTKSCPSPAKKYFFFKKIYIYIYVGRERGKKEPRKSSPLPAAEGEGQLALLCQPGAEAVWGGGVERAPVFTAAGGTFGGGCSWELGVSVWFWSIKMDVAWKCLLQWQGGWRVRSGA